ncbi:hypothetical protein ACFQ9X_54365 [Catenulispora yoronensis]
MNPQPVDGESAEGSGMDLARAALAAARSRSRDGGAGWNGRRRTSTPASARDPARTNAIRSCCRRPSRG